MKTKMLIAVILGVTMGLNSVDSAFAKGSHSSTSSSGSHAVRGYTTKKGTYVKPHMQTNPNGTQRDNWSTKGNVNPYTGKAGTKTATH